MFIVRDSNTIELTIMSEVTLILLDRTTVTVRSDGLIKATDARGDTHTVGRAGGPGSNKQ